MQRQIQFMEMLTARPPLLLSLFVELHSAFTSIMSDVASINDEKKRPQYSSSSDVAVGEKIPHSDVSSDADIVSLPKGENVASERRLLRKLDWHLLPLIRYVLFYDDASSLS